ncbi:MAG: DUF2339 domain-containing protein [Pseudomonadota bacterium]|nr:DUF2339 domain-containing protein [Pseudomonadota bacterium]
MFEALLLIAIIGFLAHLNRRVGRLEQRWEDMVAPQYHWGPEPVADQAPEIFETPAPGAEAAVAAEEPPLLAAEEPGEPPPEPEPVLDTVEEERPGGFGFEELFGRRLPIWAGGITLAVAGMLIVKLSIEAGLLSPPVRVMMGSIFGFALIGAAELALRQEARVRDERVRQALAGAGIASLYGSILVAANLYQLVGPLAAMLGMAAVTALALGLSLRFGAPSALLGLAGGLAAPALIGSDEPNVPLLSLYLALAVGGLTTVSRSQRWAWLGISALVGGFGWGLLLMLGGALSAPDTISVALYLLLLGVALPMLGFAGGWQDWLRLIAAIAAAAQMAALVATGGFSLLNWGLFGLLSLAMLWLASREQSLERLPPVGLVIALLLLGAWPDPAMREFALVAGGAALIYGMPALARLWRSAGGLVEAGQLSAITIGNLFIPMLHFYRADGSTDVGFGLLALGLAGLAALCAALGWRHEGRRGDARFAILATSSALLLAAAAALLLPGWAIGGAMAAAGIGLLHLGQAAEDRRLEPISWIFAAAGLLAGPTTALNEAPIDWQELLRWGLLAAVSAGFAWRARLRNGRIAAQFLAPILLFAALQPIVPERWEPLIAPLLLVGLAVAPLRLVPAMAAATLILLGGALVPIVNWVAEAGPSSVGDPMFVTDVASVEDALLKLLVPAALLGLSLWLARSRLERRELLTGSWIGGVLAAVALHSLYKQIFAIGSEEAFVAFGLAERTLWEALLLAGAASLWRLGQRPAAAILLGAGFAHFILYTLLLHNPLWANQAVGSLPILNLIPLAYAVPVAVLLALDWLPSIREQIPERVVTLAWMVLTLLFAASMLRQLFHGSLLVEPGLSQAEDIARSILAIALAIGFLLWGIRTRQRDWRIGSLVLMLAAVAKVFLWDTQGLEGLIRIASFVALGFSLIGIGWLYSRQLAPSKA